MKHQDVPHQERAREVTENVISYIKYCNKFETWKRNEKESSVKLNFQFEGNIQKGNNWTTQYAKTRFEINSKDEVRDPLGILEAIADYSFKLLTPTLTL